MDFPTLSQAKKFTTETAEQFGAVKGAPCTIKSISEITGGHRVTYSWVNDEEVEQTATMDVMDGVDGQDGTDGSDYVLTSQDKADIADIVLGELTEAESQEV